MATGTPFHVTVSTVAGALYEGDAISVSVPGTEGHMVVLAHHEPIVALLGKGLITLKTQSGDTKEFSVTSGVLEVSHSKAIILI